MANFKPQVSYITRESREKYFNTPSYVKGVSMYVHKEYKTYRGLKKDLHNLCKINIDARGVNVLRSRRGQWGEYYEYWKLSGDKPEIVEEGWS